MANPITERAVNMALWAIDDAGNIDNEMVDIILKNERVLLLPSHRSDLITLLRGWYSRSVKRFTVRSTPPDIDLRESAAH